MTSATMSDLVAVVAPWMPVLSSGTRLRFGERALPTRYDTVAFVDVITTTPHEPDVRIFEAVELLAVLGAVDREARDLALAQAYGTDEVKSICDIVPDGVEMACELTFAEGHTATITTWCERVVLGGAEWTASRDYLHARDRLETLLETCASTTSGESRERPRILVHVLSELDVVDTVLTQMAHVASMQQLCKSSDAPLMHRPPLFRIVFFDACMIWPAGQAMSNRWLLLMAQIASCGIQLSGLHVDSLPVEQTTARLHVPALQLLLRTNGVGNQLSKTDATSPGVGNVYLGGMMTRQAIASMFSALFTSTSVDMVAVNCELRFESNDDRRLFWQWFTLAFFSDRSTLRLDFLSVSLRNVRDREDIAAIREVLESTNPLALVCHDIGRDSETMPPRPEPLSVVAASRFALVRPAGTTGVDDDNIVTLQPQQVRLLPTASDSDGESDWPCVLLPGWGPAWVPASQLTQGVHEGIEHRDRRRLNLVNMDNTTQQTALELVRMVGNRFKALSIGVVQTTAPLDQWLEEAVPLCPSLEEFRFYCGIHLQSLTSLSRLYERTSCKLRSIRRDEIAIRDPAHVYQFFETLANPDHPMTKTLRSFNLILKNVPVRLVKLAAAVETMLKANTVLEELVLGVRYRDPRNLPQEDFDCNTRIIDLDRAPIAVQRAPLQADRKRAFLSVVHAAALPSHVNYQLPDAMQKLDSGVISLVFDYAAQCRARRVRVKFTCGEPLDSDSEDETLW